MTRHLAAALAAAGILALAGCGTAAASQPHAQPVPTVTVTASPAGTSCAARMRLTDPYLDPVQVSVLCEGVALPVATKTVTVPGPTVTVNGDSAQLQQDTTCIDDLYSQLSFDAANGHILPMGWWLEQCPVP